MMIIKNYPVWTFLRKESISAKFMIMKLVMHNFNLIVYELKIEIKLKSIV